MIVRVTKKDICRGVMGSCTRCPVVLALNRATGVEWHVIGSTASKAGGSQLCLPHKARQFIRNFDSGRPVKPFSFMMSD
jgi:hypothetical protein